MKNADDMLRESEGAARSQVLRYMGVVPDPGVRLPRVGEWALVGFDLFEDHKYKQHVQPRTDWLRVYKLFATLAEAEAEAPADAWELPEDGEVQILVDDGLPAAVVTGPIVAADLPFFSVIDGQLYSLLLINGKLARKP